MNQIPSSEDGLFVSDTFFEGQSLAKSLVALLNQLPDAIFYAKDIDSRYVAANQAMLESKRVEQAVGIIGCRDHEFHPPMLAEAYVAEDRDVMNGRRALTNQIWFVLDRSGRPGWFNSSKVPLFDDRDEVIGVAGIRTAVETPEQLRDEFQLLAPVLHHLESHYAEPISMKDMARLAKLSSSHFNRQFSDLFGMSPTRYLHSMRIEKARYLLESTFRTLHAIALDTGYYDQSHFTRHFRKHTGLTPRAYRERFRPRKAEQMT